MAKVYVTHEDPRLDYTPALQHGSSLVAIFPPGSGQVALSPQVALAHARKQLRGITQDDYLVLVGDPVMMGMCVAVAAELIGKVKLLRWDKRATKYFPIEIDFLAWGPIEVPLT